MTVTGLTLGENTADAQVHNRELVRTIEQPMDSEGGLAVLRGSLAPDGAIIRPTAASPELLVHHGRALVFDDHDEMERRIDDPDLDVSPDDVLVLRNAGPLGGPGMPEWGFLPLPKKLLEQGLRDMVRLSDARMSGTAFGTAVVHITPESAIGGPLAAVRDGDLIELDVPNRRLDLLVDDREVQRRLSEARTPEASLRPRIRLAVRPTHTSGKPRLRLRLPTRREPHQVGNSAVGARHAVPLRLGQPVRSPQPRQYLLDPGLALTGRL